MMRSNSAKCLPERAPHRTLPGRRRAIALTARLVLAATAAMSLAVAPRAGSPSAPIAAVPQAEHTMGAATAAQPAIWVRKQIRLVYLGSITQYSCYYLRDYVRHILIELGARRADLEVHPVDCGSGPPSIAGTFFALQPATGSKSLDARMAVIPARWRLVRVAFNEPYETVVDVTAKCELVRSVFDQVLPLFAVRDAHLAPACRTYSTLTNATALDAEVLEPSALTAAGRDLPAAAGAARPDIH